jgi:polyphosphate kinase 2 (PPK2 family)
MNLAATARQLSKPYRVDDGKSFRLRAVDPADTAPFESEKSWMFCARDVAERRYWNAYPRAYDDAIRETASEEAPWYVVPADRKGTAAQRRELAAARRALARG